MSENRIAYIDIAKGILICCLMYGHMLIFARERGIDDSAMVVMQKGIKLYAGFFMQSFFIITGFCSSFKRDFGDFFWRNVKTLLIPAIILVVFSDYIQEIVFDHHITTEPLANLEGWITFGAPWFILTMFFAKVAYWGLSRMEFKWQVAIIAVLYLLGIALNITDVIPNYLYHRHTLLMLPYLFLGQLCKKHYDKVCKWLPYIALFGVISILGQFVVSQFVDSYSIPVHDFNISINRTFPVHIVNAVSGTAIVMWLSKVINKSKFFETLGKGTLLIYLWNGLVNRLVLSVVPYPNGGGILQQIVFHSIVYFVILVLFYLLVKLVYETKYLRWMVGKWN